MSDRLPPIRALHIKPSIQDQCVCFLPLPYWFAVNFLFSSIHFGTKKTHTHRLIIYTMRFEPKSILVWANIHSVAALPHIYLQQRDVPIIAYSIIDWLSKSKNTMRPIQNAQNNNNNDFCCCCFAVVLARCVGFYQCIITHCQLHTAHIHDTHIQI